MKKLSIYQKKHWVVLLGVSSLFSLNNCTPQFQGEYVDPHAAEIIDDRFNDTDAHQTSKTLVESMLQKPWLTTFLTSGKKPIVIVMDIENQTDEHIDTETLRKSIENDLINSGRIRFLNAQAREAILKELTYQNESGMVAEHSAKKKGRQIGADFIVRGAISSRTGVQGKMKTKSYQTALNLTDLETSEIVWSEYYDGIKKRFTRSDSKW